MPRKPSDKRVAEAIAVLDTVRKQWLRKDGVTAVDVGYKISENTLTDVLALRVHVAEKRPVPELAASEVFNDSEDQKSLGGFPIDVIEATYGPSQLTEPVALGDYGPEDYVLEGGVGAEPVDRRARTRPLVAGISVGNPRITAGTLGAVVYDRTTCKAMILSNFHVLAGALAASAGEAVTQPGRVDGGTATDRVATLQRFRIDAQMDAAVATIDSGVAFDREVLGLGTISGTVTPTLGMNVVKSGRTTGITRGIVDGVSLTVSINYGGDVGVVTLTNQVHLVPRPPWPAVDYEVSMGGDSGSVWLEDGTNRAVGLHFAGETDPSPASENGICTPIDRVLSEFNISFLPVICRPPRPSPISFCDRYPRICELLRTLVLYRVPFPPVGPWPPVGPGPDPGPILRSQGAGEGGCGCPGHGHQGGGYAGGSVGGLAGGSQAGAVDPALLAELRDLLGGDPAQP